jgi:hypothetical protein
MKKWLEDPVVVVGVSSAAAGFVVGGIGYGTWQVATESAQVVAGLVEYPRDNPFYMYHTKLWTILHQVGAVLLRGGLSETAVSLLFSGLLGAVSFPALALATFALCRDRLLAFGVPFFVELTRAANFEIAYPIWILGSTHTYGVIGLSSALLVAALFGNGRHRAGAFALGLLPAVHPSIGAWMWLVVGSAVAWDWKAQREVMRRVLPYLAAGAAIAVVSLAVHLLVTYDVPKADAAASSRYLEAFVRLWDAHRRPAPLRTLGVYVAVGALGLCLLWLLKVRTGPPPEALLLLRILAVSGILGLGFLLLSWAPDKLPDTLLILMPSRLINLIVLAAFPLLVGLLAARRDWTTRVNLALLLLAGAVLTEQVGVGYLPPNSNFHPAFHFVLWRPMAVPVIGLGVSALLLVAAALLRPPKAAARADEKPEGKKKAAAKKGPGPLYAAPLRLATLGALAWAFFVTLARTQAHWPHRHAVMRDWRNDALLTKVSEQKGLLITSSDLHLIQLRTRRPVLIDGGGLDLLAYTLEAGPALDKILRDVYGIDMFKPPPDAVMGTIPLVTTRMAWESRAQGEWVRIGGEMGATGVLTYADWKLRLPLVASNEEFAFYRIAP